MEYNKIITSQGNVQFINSKGRTIEMHPMHCYAVYENDTVSFLFINMKEYSGQAFFASQFEDVEVNGETYDSIDALKDAITEAFAKAGAQARTEIVETLPQTGLTNTIYLVPKSEGVGYDEYIYTEDGQWELIGDTDIELDRYLQKADFNVYSASTDEYIASVSANTVQNATDIASISGSLDTEISAREAADSVISGAVDNVSASLANEASRALSAETALGGRIDTVNGRVNDEQSARATADNALQTAIDNEVSARTVADGALQSAIDTVSGDVISEVSRATSVEATKADKANAVASAEYVSSSVTIDLKNINGEVISQVDASDFIVDGMVEDVRIENGYLIIDFNTASGIEDISIPLTDIFNPENYYDKDAVDAIVSGINEDIADEVSARTDAIEALEGEISGKLDTSAFETYSGAVETAINSKANANDVYTKSQVYTKSEVDSAISGFAESSAVTEEITAAVSSKADTSDVYTKAEVDGAISAATSGKVNTSSVVTAVTSGSTDSEIPTAKAVYDAIPTGGTGGSYTAGRGIDITNDTISFNLPISAGTRTNSIAEGNSTQANGSASHAEGNSTQANGSASHAEGYYTKAKGTQSHAEGNSTTATSECAHSEGYYTKASGDYSHAEGRYTQANGTASHAEGYYTEAKNNAEHASGWYNVSSSASTTFGDSGNTLFSVGNGTADNARHNAFEIRQNGDIYLNDGTNDVKLQDTITATAANTTALGGLKLVKLTQSAYDALSPNYDNNTIYFIKD